MKTNSSQLFFLLFLFKKAFKKLKKRVISESKEVKEGKCSFCENMAEKRFSRYLFCRRCFRFFKKQINYYIEYFSADKAKYRINFVLATYQYNLSRALDFKIRNEKPLFINKCSFCNKETATKKIYKYFICKDCEEEILEILGNLSLNSLILL